MKRQTFQFELITPALACGAIPASRAEIRSASIRGQLRWWFRTLGGFHALNGLTVREQENLIFGSTAGDLGRAGLLAVRASSAPLPDKVKDMKELGAQPFTEKGYLLWPLDSRNGKSSGKAVIEAGTQFSVQLVWRGEAKVWDSLRALLSVFGHLGSLGFRGRRAMGALAVKDSMPAIDAALGAFIRRDAIVVKALPAKDANAAIVALGGWLRSWRAYGRTGENQIEQGYPGFSKAKNDHDRGADVLARRGQPTDITYRSALGLPIEQRFGKGSGTVKWEQGKNKQEKGRFASPILLRPHRCAGGQWQALIIFADSHQWPNGKPVFLDGKPRQVSLDLYNAMKGDLQLIPFP